MATRKQHVTTRKDVREALSGYKRLDSDIYDMGDYIAVVTGTGVYTGIDLDYKAGLTNPEYLRSVRSRKASQRLEEGVFKRREDPELVFIKGGHFHAFKDNWDFLKYDAFLKGLRMP